MRKLVLTACFMVLAVVGGLCFYRAISFRIEPPDVGSVMLIDTIIALIMAGAVFTFMELFMFPGSYDERTRITMNLAFSVLTFCVVTYVLLGLHHDVLRRHRKFTVEKIRRMGDDARKEIREHEEKKGSLDD
jgi:hypothetical protein